MRGSQALLFTLVMVTLSHLGDTAGECKAQDGECAAKPISAICDEDYGEIYMFQMRHMDNAAIIGLCIYIK